MDYIADATGFEAGSIVKLESSGTTLIPLEIYFRLGYAKVLLGIAKGKKMFDKRRSIKERDDNRSMEKALRRQ